jgi:hypothetical protein
MLRTRIITDRKEIEQLTPRCIEFTHKAGAVLPFNYMHLPLLWWDHFNNLDGDAFWKKRGRNFLGAQSSLNKIYLLITEHEGTICGAAPFVSYNVKMPGGRSDLCILSFAGDYVSIPYQDFLALPCKRSIVLSSILEKLIELLNNDHDLLFLGYLPESSPNIRIIRDIISSFQKQGINSLEATTSRRGGVWPWTISSLSATCRKLYDKAGNSQPVYEELLRLSEKLNDCTPQKLLFARTRNDLESQLRSILSKLSNTSQLVADISTINSLLQPSPIRYPYINLPEDGQSYFSLLSKGTRRYFRRYKRQFEEAGGSFEKISADKVMGRDVDDYIHLHVLRWGEESAAICGSSAGFHKNISLSMAKEGLFTLFFARYRGERIAVHSCFDIYLRREGYLTGRNPEYDELRAGRLLYLETIFDAIDNGFSIYDLGGVGFAYKMSFTKTYSISRNFFLYKTGEKPDLNKIFMGYECMEP